MKPSQALICVKSMLPTTRWEDNSPYICDNITELFIMEKITKETEELLKDHICTLLEGRFSLANWLVDNKHITKEELEDDACAGGELLQYTRQNWLNDMHFYFKAKGM